MKISFNSVTFYQDKYEVFFKKISESSYDAIELNAETLPWATPHVDAVSYTHLTLPTKA